MKTLLAFFIVLEYVGVFCLQPLVQLTVQNRDIKKLNTEEYSNLTDLFTGSAVSCKTRPSFCSYRISCFVRHILSFHENLGRRTFAEFCFQGNQHLYGPSVLLQELFFLNDSMRSKMTHHSMIQFQLIFCGLLKGKYLCSDIILLVGTCHNIIKCQCISHAWVQSKSTSHPHYRIRYL